MNFEYKKEIYSVIRGYTYPESEKKQHDYWQNKIDQNIKISKIKHKGSMKDDLQKFFDLINL